MSISVGAVNNVSFTGNKNKKNAKYNNYPVRQNSELARREDYSRNVSNNQMRNATKAILAMMIACPTLGTMSGCSEAESWSESYAQLNDSLLNELLKRKDSCCCCPKQVIHDTDTLYLPGDTQYVDRTDTFYIKEKFKSPVIDTLNAILHDLGNDTTGGYIPLRISFIDEMDTKYKDNLFDGQASAPENIVYNGKHYPWSDAESMFLIEPQYAEKTKYMLNLTGDGKLFVMKMIPKNGVKNPQGMDDYMYANTSMVLDRDQAAKLIRKFNVARDQVGREYDGTIGKTTLPKTIMVTNPYGTEWRWTNVNVLRGDSPEFEE